MSFQNTNNNRNLTGIDPLAYLGINASGATSASQTVVFNRAPTVNDSKNFIIGCFWLWPDMVSPAHSAQIWMLTALIANLATWTPLEAGAGLGLLTLTGNTGGAVAGTLQNINVVGAGGITVTGNPGTSTLTITTSGGVGVIDTIDGDVGYITGSTVSLTGLTTAGSSVSFVGNDLTAMVLDTTDANENTLIGAAAGNNTLSGTNNTGLGFTTLHALTTGSQNSALGMNTLKGITTGANNIALGYNAASNYTTSESSNIIIGNTGTVSESHVLRIGTNGSGSGQQSSCYIAGIDGVNVGSVARVVTEASNQLGTAIITAGAGITVTPGANTITIAAVGGGSVAGEGAFNAYGVNLTFTVPSGGVHAASLGTNNTPAAGMSTLFNNGSYFYGGDGSSTPATYTAPATGIYEFAMYGIVTMTSAGTVGLQLLATGGTYQFASTSTTSTGLVGVQSYIIPMTAGDTVQFQIVCSQASGMNQTSNFYNNSAACGVWGYRIA
jgi:hypothetical protein